jgi:phosphinothricin acetyltransferase
MGATGHGRHLAEPGAELPVIRLATEQDLAAIVEIYNASVPERNATADTEPVTVVSRCGWFHAHDARHPLWVYQREGIVAGWLSMGMFYGRPAYEVTREVSAYVAPESRRQGVGSALLAEAVAKAPSLGLRALLAFVFAHNKPSAGLFRRHGFRQWGRLPDIAELDGVARTVLILGRHVP